MPSERFYLNADFPKGARVCLIGNEHHHLSHVMRLRVNEEVELVNGRGALAHVRIADMDKQTTTLQILSSTHTPSSSIPLIAAIPLMRPSKLEWVIEKGTELGAHSFLLYRAERSEKDSLSANQIDRLHHIAISALKQSGRLYLPSIEILPHLSSLFITSHSFLFGDPSPSAPLLATPTTSTLFITGPESGFSPEELALLHQKANPVSLSPHTLRAETAPLAALSILNFLKHK